jgi:hemolysin-activating ACP:hemolysin acyltransferase
MITLQELLQQLDLRLSVEEILSLELGIHVTCPTPVVPGASSAPRDVGWHIDRLATALTNAATEVFFDEFGRYCGRLILASPDDEDKQILLEGGLSGVEMLAKPLGKEAWIVEAEFRYGTLLKGREILRRVFIAREIETIGYIDYRKSRPFSAKRRTLHWSRRGEPSGTVDSLPSFFLRTGQLRHESKTWLAERQAVGAALRVLSSCSRFRALNLSDAMSLLFGPITLDQYQIACTRAGKPIGFRSWAYFTEYAIARLINHGPRTLSVGCWNQGLKKTLVCDWSIATKEDEEADPAGTAPGRSSWAWEVLPESKYTIVSPIQGA